MIKQNITHQELVDGCLRGDRKSQFKVYEMLFGKMIAVCHRYAENEEEARDFVQIGFIKVFEKVKNFQSQGSFEGWVRRIIVNTCIDAIRKKKRMNEARVEDDQFVSIVDDSLEQQELESLKQAQAEQVVEAIQELSSGYRAVFNLYVIEDYSHKEIGEILGISEGTSKSNLAKAKQRLRKILEEKEIYV